MSICRFSSDDFTCDLYCYQSDGGFFIHVAANRYVGECPKVDWAGFHSKQISAVEFTGQFNRQLTWLQTCDRADIALPHAGKTLVEPTLEAFRDRLIELRDLGFRFPVEVLKEVDAEIAAKAQEEPNG